MTCSSKGAAEAASFFSRIDMGQTDRSVSIVRRQRQRLLVVSSSAIQIALVGSNISKPDDGLLVGAVGCDCKFVLLLCLSSQL